MPDGLNNDNNSTQQQQLPPPTSLSRLTHDAVQDTYKTLHALLDSLSDDSSTSNDKQKKLIDFFLNMRHRFARLLVIVRWFMSYSAFHTSAQVARNQALLNCYLYTADADTLFYRLNNLRNLQSVPCALPEAAEILSTFSFNRLPSIIPSSIGIDFKSLSNKFQISTYKKSDVKMGGNDNYDDDDGGDGDGDDGDDVTKEALERLKLHTRRVINDCLPKGICILDEECDEHKGIPVRIGVNKVWNADIIMDSLKNDNFTNLRLLRFEIKVDGHPDAPTQMQTRRRTKERSLPLKSNDVLPLREMIDDRMKWSATPSGNDEKFEIRMKKAMSTLCSIMSLECCTSIAMAHIREQVGAMMLLRKWREGEIDVIGRWTDVNNIDNDESIKRKGKIGVSVGYWKKGYLKSKITFDGFREEDVSFDNNDTTGLIEIINIRHEPELPKLSSSSSDNSVKVNISSINVQQIVVESGRIRAKYEFEKICKSLCSNNNNFNISTEIMDWGASCCGLACKFYGGGGFTGVGLMIGMSLMTGGIYVRCRGVVNIIIGKVDEVGKELRKLLWSGERFFKNEYEIECTILNIVKEASVIAWKGGMVRSILGSGDDAMMTWPAGRSFLNRPKDMKPPFTAMEKKRPRTFMTLNCSDDNENTAKRPRTGSSDAGDLSFIQMHARKGMKKPETEMKWEMSACGMALWAEMKHEIRRRMMREKLVWMLKEQGVISSWYGSDDGEDDDEGEARVELRCQPLEVERAVVRILQDERWVLEVKLCKDLFYESRRMLRFWYNHVNSHCVRTCVREIVRARASATLGMGLLSKTGVKKYRLVEWTHRSVLVESFLGDNQGGQNSGDKLYLHVGLGSTSIEVATWPENNGVVDVLKSEVIPLVEEVLSESRKQMGQCLQVVLNVTIPIAVAIDRAVVGAVGKDSSARKERIKIKFASILRGRIVFSHGSSSRKGVYGLDIDAHRLNGKIVLTDVGKARKHRMEQHQSQQQGQQQSQQQSQQQQPMGLIGIPAWKAVVDRLTENKVAAVLHHASALEMHLDLLYKVVHAILKSVVGAPEIKP